MELNKEKGSGLAILHYTKQMLHCKT